MEFPLYLEDKCEEFVKRAFVSETVDLNSRGMLLGRWNDRIMEYVCESCADGRERLEQARKECLDRKRWRLFCLGHLLKGFP